MAQMELPGGGARSSEKRPRPPLPSSWVERQPKSIALYRRLARAVIATRRFRRVGTRLAEYRGVLRRRALRGRPSHPTRNEGQARRVLLDSVRPARRYTGMYANGTLRRGQQDAYEALIRRSPPIRSDPPSGVGPDGPHGRRCSRIYRGTRRVNAASWCPTPTQCHPHPRA